MFSSRSNQFLMSFFFLVAFSFSATLIKLTLMQSLKWAEHHSVAISRRMFVNYLFRNFWNEKCVIRRLTSKLLTWRTKSGKLRSLEKSSRVFKGLLESLEFDWTLRNFLIINEGKFIHKTRKRILLLGESLKFKVWWDDELEKLFGLKFWK